MNRWEPVDVIVLVLIVGLIALGIAQVMFG
jgi:hypothetical protein